MNEKTHTHKRDRNSVIGMSLLFAGVILMSGWFFEKMYYTGAVCLFFSMIFSSMEKNMSTRWQWIFRGSALFVVVAATLNYLEIFNFAG